MTAIEVQMWAPYLGRRRERSICGGRGIVEASWSGIPKLAGFGGIHTVNSCKSEAISVVMDTWHFAPATVLLRSKLPSESSTSHQD